MPNTREMRIEQVEDILAKWEFFYGQRAGRELWAEKPKDVQEKDIEAFNRDISFVRDFVRGVTIQKWIPVTERLPALHTDDYEELDGSRMQIETSDNQWVVTAYGYQTKARYETGVVFQGWVGECGETIRNVTHWMPLPEPPKED